jgi:hypothetical protein
MNALSHSSTGKTGDVHRTMQQVSAQRPKYYKDTQELQGQVCHLRQQIKDMNVRKFYMPSLDCVVLTALPVTAQRD